MIDPAPPAARPGDAATIAPRHFRFRHSVEVRFRDLDPMGHVHHAVPLFYFEEARAAYWREVAGQGGLSGIGYIMGEVSMRYHGRIHFPQTLDVLARVSRLGGRSWTMQYQLRDAGGELLASGESTQVMYDYAAGGTTPIPDDIRERISRYENG